MQKNNRRFYFVFQIEQKKFFLAIRFRFFVRWSKKTLKSTVNSLKLLLTNFAAFFPNFIGENQHYYLH